MFIGVDYLRQWDISGFVIFDWTITIITAIIVGKIADVSILAVLIVLLLMSIPLHLWCGVPTMTNYYLGLSELPLRMR